MSRLDFMIRRLTAQRVLLQQVAELIPARSGPIFEVGLGSGRTYDHMRGLFPDREIFVFDRSVEAPLHCLPDAAHMIVGEIRDTLRLCGPRIREKPVFIHIDIGTGDPTTDAITSEWLPSRLEPWIEPGTIILADRPIALEALTEIPRSAEAPKSTHVLYRVAG
ncbi:MAG: class I SAM-dependent methyltransferase [Pseudomonadota bacterium]